MKKLFLLLGVMMVLLVSGCGQSDPIEGTWVNKIQADQGIDNIQFIKENDFSYKGIVTYKTGRVLTSHYNFDKNYNELAEDEVDGLKHNREHGRIKRLFFPFNDKYTEMMINKNSKPEDIFIKK